MQELLQHIDSLKKELLQFQLLENKKIQDALDIEYTFESNRIEGNTLTLQETQLVIEKGLTIGGKSLQEHLEAINHKEAIDFIKDIVHQKIELTATILLQLHSIILKSIDKENAGVYRKVPVMILGSKHLPPQPYLLQKLMEDYFIFYTENKTTLHPVILCAEMHERLVSIHPFIDGNGRTSRLIMNLILLQNGFPIANIKGSYQSRMRYYGALESCRTEHNKNQFFKFISEIVVESMQQKLNILGAKS